MTTDAQASMSPRTVDRLGLAAAAMAWLAAGFPTWIHLADDPSRLSEPRWMAWVTLWLVFALLAYQAIRAVGRHPRWALGCLLAETAIALTLTAMDITGLAPILLVIIAAQVADVVALRWAIAWVLIQTFAMAVADVWSGNQWLWSLVEAGAYLGFQAFALLTSALAQRERRGREELARVNAELIATRALLAENTRVGERLRIARELHDLLGHHLTSLSLNLEVAGHLTEGKAHDHVEQARSLARLLLSDVREAVREIRRDVAVDLARALHSLVEGVPRPKVYLLVPETLACDDPERAHAVLRCVQEILTNTVRHARAENLWIEIEEGDGELLVRAWDDGRGVGEIEPGPGLLGMRERLQDLQGSLLLESAAGRGFRVEARVPLSEGAP